MPRISIPPARLRLAEKEALEAVGKPGLVASGSPPMMLGEQQVDLGVSERRVGVGGLVEREVGAQGTVGADQLDQDPLEPAAPSDLCSLLRAQRLVGGGRVVQQRVNGRDPFEHGTRELGGDLHASARIPLGGERGELRTVLKGYVPPLGDRGVLDRDHQVRLVAKAGVNRLDGHVGGLGDRIDRRLYVAALEKQVPKSIPRRIKQSPHLIENSR